MSKKITGFNLISSNFKYMSTCTSLLRKLSSSEFWPLCTEYPTSRVKTRCCFKDQPVQRCEVQDMRGLDYFLAIFYCNLHYYKHLVPKFMNISVQWFQEMTTYCQLIEENSQRKQFFKGFKIIFPYYAKHPSCITWGLL